MIHSVQAPAATQHTHWQPKLPENSRQKAAKTQYKITGTAACSATAERRSRPSICTVLKLCGRRFLGARRGRGGIAETHAHARHTRHAPNRRCQVVFDSCISSFTHVCFFFLFRRKFQTSELCEGLRNHVELAQRIPIMSFERRMPRHNVIKAYSVFSRASADGLVTKPP